MYQSCKDILPRDFGKRSAALLAKNKKGPLTTAEKAAVGNALKGAIGALQGHGGSSKMSSCMSYFADGVMPANPENDAMYQSCKEYLPHDFGKRSAALLAKNKKGPLTTAEKAAVGNALQGALGALQ